MKADLPTIELEGVAKRYGAVEAVRDVSFALPQGGRVRLGQRQQHLVERAPSEREPSRCARP